MTEGTEEQTKKTYRVTVAVTLDGRAATQGEACRYAEALVRLRMSAEKCAVEWIGVEEAKS